MQTVLCFRIGGFPESWGKIFSSQMHEGNYFKRKKLYSIYFQAPFAMCVRVPPGAVLGSLRDTPDLQDLCACTQPPLQELAGLSAAGVTEAARPTWPSSPPPRSAVIAPDILRNRKGCPHLRIVFAVSQTQCSVLGHRVSCEARQPRRWRFGVVLPCETSRRRFVPQKCQSRVVQPNMSRGRVGHGLQSQPGALTFPPPDDRTERSPRGSEEERGARRPCRENVEDLGKCT